MKTIFKVCLLFTLAVYCFSQNKNRIFPVTDIPSGSSADEIAKIAGSVRPSEQQIKWQEQEFTFFIHFGINTFTDREWGRKQDDSKEFNPSSLDANQWVKTVKEAGGKTMIVLAKHHDGFCYWPTKTTGYSVKNSPWKNGKGDLLYETAKACKKYGIKLGIYLSPWDIVSPIYGTDEYNEHFRNQLRELLTNYGEVAEVWFDGACGEGPNGKKQVYDWNSYYRVIRELQPNAVIAIMGPDVRWVGTESGKGRATEWSVVPAEIMNQEKIANNSQQSDTAKTILKINMMDSDLGSRNIIAKAAGLMWYPSEVDVSIRPGWFYHKKDDSLVKTPEQLADIYFTSVGMNSVLLLNVPPDRRGLMNEADIKSLKGMRKILNATFKINLAADASVTALNGKKGFKTACMLDNDNKTYWTTNENIYNAELELTLKKKKTFDCLMLQENFRNGQRIEEFSFEAWINNDWQQVIKGTTAGYKRLLRFPEVSADKVRIKILKSRGCPEISSIGLYKIAMENK